MPTDTPLRVAIVGAGIGGLTLYQALAFMDLEHKLDVRIYESAKQLSPIGAGVGFWPRAMEIMKSIGLGDRLTKILNPVQLSGSMRSTVFRIRKGDQREGMHVLDVHEKGFNFHFRRSELQQALSSHLTNEIYLSHRLVSYEVIDDEVILQFQDGTTASCDFLVGADGIRSHVRRCFLEHQGLSHSRSMYPIWIGAYAYRGLISAEQLQSAFPGHRACDSPMVYLGKDKVVSAYRVSRANLISIAAIVTYPSKEGTALEGPTSVECSPDEVLSVFHRWEPEVLALLKCLHRPIKWAVETLPPLPSYARGPVALVGDSAHAMPPYQGSGASQAVEDIYILASLLTSSHCTKSTLPKISDIYDTVRRGPGNKIVELSLITGKFYQLGGPGFEDVVEGQSNIPLNQLLNVFETIGKKWEPLLKESFGDCQRRALQMLEGVTK